jgi:PAS domain S-box-containing protein
MQTPLTESEVRFRRMADFAPVMVWVSGTDRLCTYFNRPWLEFTGRALEQELGNGWSEGVHPADLDRCLNTYVQAFDARADFRMEYRLRRFDGAYRWVLDSGAPRFAADGTFEGYIGSCIDVTDQKRVEESLRDSEARYRLLLESTHAIPWMADAETHRFSYVGRQATAILGYPLDGWYERDFWLDRLHPEDRDSVSRHFHECCQKPADYRFDYRMIAADRRVVWIHDIVNVTVDGQGKNSLRGFMIDVSAARYADEEVRTLREQLLRAGRISAMGVLAASIAHEINQPLCAIVSNSQAAQRLLENNPPDLAEINEALKDITRDSQRASAVLARIRGFLRNSSASRTPVDINQQIIQVLELARGEMSRRGIAVRLELAQDLPQVLCDRVQIQQVLLNLITNAADAMERVVRSFRELTIRTTADDSRQVIVAVKDTGVGVEAKNLDRIFEPFFTTKAESIGMGLAICRSIMETHGGRISASPNTDYGATVRFTLPGTGELPS